VDSSLARHNTVGLSCFVRRTGLCETQTSSLLGKAVLHLGQVVMWAGGAKRLTRLDYDTYENSSFTRDAGSYFVLPCSL
jgi:hypothetical protein